MSSLKLTLRAWPLIAILTIGLCYLTQLVAGWFGVELKEQMTVEQMRFMGTETWKILTQQGLRAALTQEISFKFIINIPLVIAILPFLEECIFRGLLFTLPQRLFSRYGGETPPPHSSPTSQSSPTSGRVRLAPVALAIISSVLFSAAHYLQMPWPNDAFLALFFFGLAQCWLYRKTGHLWCAMLNHGLFNLTNLVLLFILPEA